MTDTPTIDFRNSSQLAQLMRYRPEIDGLRAISIIMVVLYHARIGCPGGFVGVDVFFVISGYLITGLIWTRLEKGTFTLVDFWERRIRRIYPALALMLICSLGVGAYILMPHDYDALAKSVLAQCMMIANVYFLHASGGGGGYFTPVSHERPLLHCWSLAVEEQFYLLFPVLLIWVFRFSKSRHTYFAVWLLFALAIVSLAWSQYDVQVKAERAFYLLPSRSWELICGGILALVGNSRLPTKRLWSEAMSWMGVLFILIACCFYDHHTVFPGLSALLPCVGAMLVIAGIKWVDVNGNLLPASVCKLLSWRPLVFIGLISYSWYLWHWPVLVLGSYWWLLNEKPMMLRATLVVLSLIPAVLSWYWVEQSFRLRRIASTRRRLFISAIAVTLFLFLVSGLVILKKGMPQRFDLTTVLNAVNAIDDHPDGDLYKRSTEDIREDKPVWLGLDDAKAPISLVLWGDSHAMHIEPAIDRLCEKLKIRGAMLSHVGVQPMPNKHAVNELIYHFSLEAFDFIRRHRVPNVILAGRWMNRPGTKEGLLETIHALEALGVKVWVLLDVPDLDMPAPKMAVLAERLHRQKSVRPRTVEEHRLRNEVMYKLSEDKSVPATFLDLSQALLNEERTGYIITWDGHPVYSDEDHLTQRAARTIMLPFFTSKLGLELTVE